MAERSAHELIDELSPAAARAALTRCCGSSRWVSAMLERRPFRSAAALERAADEIWAGLERDDYLEAFAHHPRIGADPAEVARRFAATRDWSSAEQSGVNGADSGVLRELRALNQSYEQRFGHTFIVCASGKTASEMLALLRARLDNEPAAELAIAAGEQAKISKLRLRKLAE